MYDGDVKPLRRAFVVFSGQTDLAWLKVLRQGYRHCFVAVESGPGDGGKLAPWVIYNPLSHCTEIAVLAGLDAKGVAGFYRGTGCRVIQTHVLAPVLRPVPLRPYTCVEAVKRVLGLRAPWVFTPWQLSEYIKKSPKEKIILDKRN